MPLSEVRELRDRGQLDDGASITALLYLLAFASIGTTMKPAETVPEAGATSRRIPSQPVDLVGCDAPLLASHPHPPRRLVGCFLGASDSPTRL